MEYFIFVVVQQSSWLLPLWVVSALVATYVGVQRGIGFLAFLNGVVLGPLGVLFVVIQKDNRRVACPHCAEQVLKVAKVCPHCRSETGFV